jgi:hypothetical protein
MRALTTAPPFGADDPRTADGHSPNAEPFRLSRSARLPWLQLRTRDGKAQRAYLKSLLQGNPSRLFDATALLHAAEQAALDDVQGLGEAAAEEAASEFASPLLLACLAAGVSPRTDRSTGTAATFKPPDTVGALLSAAVDRMLRAADQVPHPTRPTRASAHYGAALLTLLSPAPSPHHPSHASAHYGAATSVPHRYSERGRSIRRRSKRSGQRARPSRSQHI